MGTNRATMLLTGDLESSPVPLATKLIDWWQWFVDTLVVSYPVANLWVMSVGIYLLLRRLIDETEMDEVELAKPPLSTASATDAPESAVMDAATTEAADE